MNSFPDHQTLRRRTATRAEQFLSEELSLPPDPQAIEDFGNNPDLRIIEFAHTPHFGHLGFVRMLVSAATLAAERDDRALLLVFNDHVLANALPTIRHIPLARDGVEMEKPPALGVAKADRDRPLCFIPSPTPQALAAACDAVRSVLLYERARAHSPISKAQITAHTSDLFQLLTENALAVRSFSTWCIRSLVTIMRAAMPRPIPVLPLVGSHLVEIMPEHFAMALSRRDEIMRCQTAAATQQNPPWPEWSRPKVTSEEFFPAWALCERCQNATDQVRVSGTRLEIHCRNHQFAHELGNKPQGFKISPKVVLRQPLASLLDLEFRVCGNRLGYWQVADELVQTLFVKTPPPRVPVTGSVRFEGLAGLLPGAPPMLRVLSEMPVTELLNQLRGANDSHLTVRSNPALLMPAATKPST